MTADRFVSWDHDESNDGLAELTVTVSPSEESLVEFGILGLPEAVRDERTLSLPRGRGRALLALLILRVGQVVTSDRLIDELWGERPPPTAATALQGLASNLRKRLEPLRPPPCSWPESPAMSWRSTRSE